MTRNAKIDVFVFYVHDMIWVTKKYFDCIIKYSRKKNWKYVLFLEEFLPY